MVFTAFFVIKVLVSFGVCKINTVDVSVQPFEMIFSKGEDFSGGTLKDVKVFADFTAMLLLVEVCESVTDFV